MNMIRGGRLEDTVELDGKKPLGKGTFGTVYGGRMKGGAREAVAVKIMLKEKMKAMRVPDSMVKREAEMMQECRARREFVHFHELIDTSSQYCMVLELCAGGDLQEAAQQGNGILGEAQVRLLMRQMLQGLDFLHRRRICHRDVKPHNYLLDGDVRSESVRVKLADFGIAVCVKPGKLLTEQAGTPAFMAPEMHLLPKKSKGYDVAVDLWAVGVVMVFLLASEYPFIDGSGRLLRDKIIRGEQPLWEADVFSGLFQRFQEAAGIAKKRPSRLSRELSRRLLTPRRQDRITVEAACRHEWFTRPIADGDDGGDDAPLLNWAEITSGLVSIEKEFLWVVSAGAAMEVDGDDPRHMPQLDHRDERLVTCAVCCRSTGQLGYMCPRCNHTVCLQCVRRLPRSTCPHCGHDDPQIAMYQAVDRLPQQAVQGVANAMDAFAGVDLHLAPSRAEMSRQNACNICFIDASSTDYLCPVCAASVCRGCVRSKLDVAPMCPCCGDIAQNRPKIQEYLAAADALEQAMVTGKQLARRLSMGFSDSLGITSERVNPATDSQIGRHPGQGRDNSIGSHWSREHTAHCRGGFQPITMPIDLETEYPLDRGPARRPDPPAHRWPPQTSSKWCCLCDEAPGVLDHVCSRCSASICSMCIRGRFLHDPTCPHCGILYDDAIVQRALSSSKASAAARSLWTGLFGCKKSDAPSRASPAAGMDSRQSHRRVIVSL